MPVTAVGVLLYFIGIAFVAGGLVTIRGLMKRGSRWALIVGRVGIGLLAFASFLSIFQGEGTVFIVSNAVITTVLLVFLFIDDKTKAFYSA